LEAAAAAADKPISRPAATHVLHRVPPAVSLREGKEEGRSALDPVLGLDEAAAELDDASE
jgi:hypothetical protein